MKRKFKIDVSLPDFEKMSDEEFMSELRVYEAKLSEKSEEESNGVITGPLVPRGAHLEKSIITRNSVIDYKESAYEYFLSVRARKIIHEAIGEKSTFDIKRFKKQFPEEDELIRELEETSLNLPTVRQNNGRIPLVPATDFSIFSNSQEFEHYIDCSQHDVVHCIAEYVRYKSASIKRNSILSHYPSIVYYLLKLEYENDLTLKPIVVGNLFFTNFEKYLYSHNLSTKTIKSMISSLKTVLKWSALYGAKVAIDIDAYSLKENYKRPRISLTYEEICKIYYYDFNHMNLNEKLKNTYERVRDHFVLSCFLGQRFSDTVRITSTNFDKSAGKFKITQQKTGNKAVVCFNDVFGEFPIIAREILEKYEYNAPWTGTMSTFNQRLHEICKYAGLDDRVKHEVNNRGAIVVKSFPKYELISSHCARRTFITNCVKRGLHSQQIKRASGHTSDKSFGLYVIWGDDVD